MDRRTFLLVTSLGAMTVAAPKLLDAGAADSIPAGDLLATADGFQSVGPVSQLQDNQLQVQVGNVPLLVIRHPDGSYAAFNRRCTHAGCPVNWQGNQNKFVCPCHNSQFSASGQVLQGPARSPLHSYPVKVQGDQILVKFDA